ncbi:orc1/cdc6 family replication initiation protein [Halobaculum sp. CBA1158]|uniref:Cdc6/Cdc18 family protein n=1 Tax=Halobaculum sp. CBA1158 TaxID=2904243 RepID=UPI001F2682EC|nr:orc1/cdc6 family replication initiation protein [Halobaculum sp. CBA1158]UIO99800.1 orc1/cdc6 family replication initiation protein [Halobaculum sp. CBA1158]
MTQDDRTDDGTDGEGSDGTSDTDADQHDAADDSHESAAVDESRAVDPSGTGGESGGADESERTAGESEPTADESGSIDVSTDDASSRGVTPDIEDTPDAGDTPDIGDDSGSFRFGSGSRSRADVDLDVDDLDVDEVLGDDDEASTGLFDDLLSGEPIFENKEVLRPSYTPHELPHRNDQINKMATILVSALRGETPSNILIYGKTGTGKTASAKFVSQELESTSQKYDVPCEVEYINCEVTDTQYRVLAQLANKFIEKNEAVIDDRLDDLRDLRSEATDRPDALTDSEFDAVADIDDRIADLESDREEMEEVPMTGWPTDRVYSTFFDAVDYHERVVVIMLDEIDKLVEKSGDDTLYNLSRMNSELENSRISIMGISNDLKFTDFLDPRVKSSLGEEEIVFPPYDANQLRDILQHRSDIAFKGDALTEDVIPLCAAFAAQEHGDARRALDLLRTAGELAERSQADLVEEAHVRQAQDKIELDRVVEVVRTLPTQSKIVLFSIILLEQNGVHNVNTGEVFNIYKRLCEEIDADVLTQRRVTDLISELDMLGIVNAVVVSKGRYGRTKEISLSVPIDETEAVLMSDSRLGDIEDVQPFVQARFDN